MGFFAHLPASVRLIGATWETRRVVLRHARTLIPLHHFTDTVSAESTFDSIRASLQERTDMDIQIDSIMTILTELADNAASHGKSSHGAFLVGERLPSLDVHVVVGDCGVGIRQHLSRNPKHRDLADDAAAIRQAVERGATGTSDARGWGFDSIEEDVRLYERGEIHVRSGYGLGRMITTRRSSAREFRTESVMVDGTIVGVIVTA
jgi:anti-sigma regulatory factor (Ser/Thr protein kinase)